MAVQTEPQQTLPIVLHDAEADTNIDYEELFEHEHRLVELREQTKLLELALAEQREQEQIQREREEEYWR